MSLIDAISSLGHSLATRSRLRWAAARAIADRQWTCAALGRGAQTKGSWIIWFPDGTAERMVP